MADDKDNATASLLGPVVKAIPEGDDRERNVCMDCGFIHYDNPRIIAGAVCTWEDKVLLCSRAIEPRIGYWTIPAGYLELGETIAEGAAREVREESGARVETKAFLGLFELPHISQVYALYHAEMISPDLDPGPESLDAKLYDWAQIPWDDLAFPSVGWSLNLYKSGAAPAVGVYRR